MPSPWGHSFLAAILAIKSFAARIGLEGSAEEGSLDQDLALVGGNLLIGAEKEQLGIKARGIGLVVEAHGEFF